MNEIAKKCIQTKLIVAIEKEGLKTSEAAKILDISPTYVSLIKNSDHWHKCTKAAWEAVQKWTNSGLSLREYSIERQFPNYDKAIEDHNKRTQWIISGLQGNKEKDYMKGDKWDDTKTPSQDDLINAVKEAIITEDQKVNLVEYVDGLLKEDTECSKPKVTHKEYHIPGIRQFRSEDEIHDGDLGIVKLPVRVILTWSDKIIADYDSETGEVLEYASGYLMEVLSGQKFVYKGEVITFLGSVMREK